MIYTSDFLEFGNVTSHLRTLDVELVPSKVFNHVGAEIEYAN